jgi:transketolase
MNIRQQFVATVESLLAQDERLMLLLGDIGVFGFRNSFAQYPQRVINIGILEQATVSFAAGLAREGLVPIFHSIAPFVVERAYEQLKNDFCYQQLGGNLVSVGASFDYASLGCTHHCPGDVGILKNLPGMQVVTPGNSAEFDALFRSAYANGSPTYFRLSERVHKQTVPVKFGEAAILREGTAATLVVVAQLLDHVIEAVAGLDVSILYYSTVSPFDRRTLAKHANTKIICVEPFYEGTLAGEIAAALHPRPFSLTSIGVPRRFLTHYGKLADHEAACGFDSRSLRQKITSVLDG